MAKTISDVKRGQHWRDRNGHYRVMAVAEGYAMIRRKGCAPFVRSAKEIERNDTRLAVASTTPPPRRPDMVSDLLRAWTDAEVRYELTKQQAAGIHTWGIGACGHPARGSGVCASCLTAELDRRQALTGEVGRMSACYAAATSSA